MHIIRFRRPGAEHAEVGIRDDDQVKVACVASVADLLTLRPERVRELVEAASVIVDGPIEVLAPVDGATEVWACGVTYLRSRQGRTEESTEPTIYDRVYEASRPELFFKSVAWRVVGDDSPIGVRADSTSDLPEPELALVLNREGEIIGYTICNDVTSRTLEGENPLYLPQAKIFAGSCALGPGIAPAWTVPDPRDLAIEVTVRRGNHVAWSDRTSTAQLRPELSALVDVLFSADEFPHGAVLSTGTGLVPGLEFSLADGDVVEIGIDGIGTLTNTVVRGKEAWLNSRATQTREAEA